MLIPYLYVYVIIGLFVVLAVALGIYSDKAPEEKQQKYKAMAWVGGIAAVLIGILVLLAGGKTYIFEGRDAASIKYDKLLLFGTKHIKVGEHEFDLANGSGALVVNATAIPLMVHTAEYSSISFSFGGGKADELIPPGSTHRVEHGIDNFGPNDPLPSSVSSKSSFETRVQITW